MNSAILFWSMLFGVIGFGYFLYGRKQKAAIPLLSGIALMVFPYFVHDLIIVIFAGTSLVAIPYFISI